MKLSLGSGPSSGPRGMRLCVYASSMFHRLVPVCFFILVAARLQATVPALPVGECLSPSGRGISATPLDHFVLVLVHLVFHRWSAMHGLVPGADTVLRPFVIRHLLLLLPPTLLLLVSGQLKELSFLIASQPLTNGAAVRRQLIFQHYEHCSSCLPQPFFPSRLFA